MIDLKAVQSELHSARAARIEAQLAGCEMEELAANLHDQPPVGRWPQLTRATHGPRLFLFSN
jgi:hypothetical protein